jgi:hypothetical protein
MEVPLARADMRCMKRSSATMVIRAAPPPAVLVLAADLRAAALEAAHLAAAPAVLRAAVPMVHHLAVHPEKKRVMANTPMQGPGTVLNSTVMATTGTLEIRKKTTKLAIDHRAILHRQGSNAAASGLKERRAPNKGRRRHAGEGSGGVSSVRNFVSSQLEPRWSARAKTKNDVGR